MCIDDPQQTVDRYRPRLSRFIDFHNYRGPFHGRDRIQS